MVQRIILAKVALANYNYMKKLILLILLFSNTAFAADWECLVSSKDQYGIYKNHSQKTEQQIKRWLGFPSGWTTILITDYFDRIVINEKPKDATYAYKCYLIK